MDKVFLRAPYNYDSAVVSDETALKCEDESLAKQSFKEECDINTIVDRFGIGYDAPEGLVAPVYGDFTGIGDYHSAIRAVRSAAETFMQLSADVRSRFENDAGKFVDFCSNEANRAELERLGLAVPKPVAAVPAAPVPAPVPAAAPAAGPAST